MHWSQLIKEFVFVREAVANREQSFGQCTSLNVHSFVKLKDRELLLEKLSIFRPLQLREKKSQSNPPRLILKRAVSTLTELSSSLIEFFLCIK